MGDSSTQFTPISMAIPPQRVVLDSNSLLPGGTTVRELPHLSTLTAADFPEGEKVYVVTHPFFQLSQGTILDTQISFPAKSSPREKIIYALQHSYALRKSNPEVSKLIFQQAVEALELDHYLRGLADQGATVIFVLCPMVTTPEFKQYLSKVFADNGHAAYIESVYNFGQGLSTGHLEARELTHFTNKIPIDTPIELSGTYYDICGLRTYQELRDCGRYTNISYKIGPSFQPYHSIIDDSGFDQLWHQFTQNFSADNPTTFYDSTFAKNYLVIQQRYYNPYSGTSNPNQCYSGY